MKRFRLVQRRESTAGGSGTAVILNLRLSLSHTTIVSPTEKHLRISTAVVTTNTTTTNNSTSSLSCRWVRIVDDTFGYIYNKFVKIKFIW